jgi:hypothetical protein
LGSRAVDDAAKGVVAGVTVAVVIAVMGVRRTRDNRSCGDTMPAARNKKGREYFRWVTRRTHGPGRGILLILPV